jgi:hypothetical protein
VADAREALSRANSLRSHSTTVELLLLAMVHWHLGEQGTASQYYAMVDKTSESSEDTDVCEAHVALLRAEAKAMLGMR